MFDSDKWLEILTTMVQNPLRSVMIIMAVGIGMFILVILQGLGTGLQNGVVDQFDDDAINSLRVRSGRTTMGYGGYKPNRRIQFTDADHDEAAQNIQGTLISSGQLQRWGMTTSYGNKSANYSLRCVNPAYQEIEKTEVLHGRYLNEQDMKERRKVAVVGGTIVAELFGGGNPVGQYISVSGIRFQVVGSYDNPSSRWENRVVYTPLTTGQALFAGNRPDIDSFVVSTGSDEVESTVQTSEIIDGYLRSRYIVHPEDSRAVSVNNNKADFQRFANILIAIKVFLFIIGGLTLLAGIIGVSTIMNIVVQDRKREFGIRKSIGATPGSILSLIVMESVFITLISGMLGLIFAVLGLELMSVLVEHPFFSNPQLSLGVCMIALGILIVSGLVAGLIPGTRAAAINPIEALKAE